MKNEESVLALIECPHCGKPVSQHVSLCPHCGRPIELQKRVNEDYVEQKKLFLEDYWSFLIWGSLLIPFIGVWLMLVLILLISYFNKEHVQKMKRLRSQAWTAWVVGVIIWTVVSCMFFSMSRM